MFRKRTGSSSSCNLKGPLGPWTTSFGSARYWVAPRTCVWFSARGDRSWHLYFGRRPETQDPALYPPLSEDSQALSMEILRCPQTDSGVVAIAQGQPTRRTRRDTSG